MTPRSRNRRGGRFFEAMVLVSVLGVLGLALAITANGLSGDNDPDASTLIQKPASPSPISTPNLGPYPAPDQAPTPTLPPMTPVPPFSSDPLTQPTTIVSEVPQMPTPQPNQPVQAGIIVEGEANTYLSVLESPVIVIGTVQQVGPARWNTPDGTRPANPHDLSTGPHEIFRPVVLQVDEYLRGPLPVLELQLFAWGGTIGQDSFTFHPEYLYELHEGERVVLFLKPRDPAQDQALGDQPWWNIMEQYTITPDGQATNVYRTLPLEELRAEITDAVLSEVTPALQP